MNGSDKMANVKMAVDDVLCQRTALRIPDIDPNHSHVVFGRHFDNSRP